MEILAVDIIDAIIEFDEESFLVNVHDAEVLLSAFITFKVFRHFHWFSIFNFHSFCNVCRYVA